MSNFRSGYLATGTPLGATTMEVTLTADNQNVDVISNPISLLKLSSNSASASARTFVLTPSTILGHFLTIIFESGSSYTAQLVDGGSCQLDGDWTPLQYDSIMLRWDGNYWVESARNSAVFPSGGIVNANVSASAAIDFSKLAVLPSTDILVGSAGGVATARAMTGDVTISNTGVTTIAALAVDNSKVSASAAIAYSKLAALTSAHILVGSGSNVATDVALSGDATLANTGALTIAAAAVGVSKLAAPVMVEATGTLTQANILAMNGTPVTLLAAPGSGLYNVIDEIELLHSYSTAAYASGGDVTVQYANGTAVMVIDTTFVTAGSSASTLVVPAVYTSSGTDTGFSLTPVLNQALNVTNAVGAFTTGNVANVIKWRIRYHTVTAQT